MSRDAIPPLLVLGFLLSISCASIPTLDIEVANDAPEPQEVELRGKAYEWITMTADLPPGGSANVRVWSKSPEGTILTRAEVRELTTQDQTSFTLDAQGRLTERHRRPRRCD